MKLAITMVFSAVILLGAGCIPANYVGDDPVVSTPTLELREADKPYRLTFYIRTGWTGGMGSLAVVDKISQEPIRLNGLPIYFDESYKKQVDEAYLRDWGLSSCRGSESYPIIEVSATVTVSQEHGTNDSVLDAPVESFYQVNVADLFWISVINKSQCT